jgi:hypothetical protein
MSTLHQPDQLAIKIRSERNQTRPFWVCLLALLLASSSIALHGKAQTNASGATPSNTQPALVTFFSNGMSLLGGLPGHRSQSFRGKLFDGDQQLASMEPAHFITFTLCGRSKGRRGLQTARTKTP